MTESGGGDGTDRSIDIIALEAKIGAIESKTASVIQTCIVISQVVILIEQKLTEVITSEVEEELGMHLNYIGSLLTSTQQKMNQITHDGVRLILEPGITSTQRERLKNSSSEMAEKTRVAAEQYEQLLIKARSILKG